MNRRNMLLTFSGLIGSILLLPLRVLAFATTWNKAAFEATRPETAVTLLTSSQPEPSNQIDIIAPDFAENGAIVQIEIESHIPDTEAIAILADKNPTSLIANFMFSDNALPKVITRIKLAETGMIEVIVKAQDRYFQANRKVEVSAGGCG